MKPFNSLYYYQDIGTLLTAIKKRKIDCSSNLLSIRTFTFALMKELLNFWFDILEKHLWNLVILHTQK